MNDCQPIREGQVLTGPLFNEPMRVQERPELYGKLTT